MIASKLSRVALVAVEALQNGSLLVPIGQKPLFRRSLTAETSCLRIARITAFDPSILFGGGTSRPFWKRSSSGATPPHAAAANTEDCYGERRGRATPRSRSIRGSVDSSLNSVFMQSSLYPRAASSMP